MVHYSKCNKNSSVCRRKQNVILDVKGSNVPWLSWQLVVEDGMSSSGLFVSVCVVHQPLRFILTTDN